MGGPQGWSRRGQCTEEEKGLRKSGPVGLPSVDDWKSEMRPLHGHLPTTPPPPADRDQEEGGGVILVSTTHILK